MLCKNSDNSRSGSLYHISRLVIGIIALITSCLLVLFSYKNYSRVSEVQKTLTEAGSKTMAREIRSKIGNPSQLTKEKLAEIISECSPEEITYLAILHHGSLILESGTATIPLPEDYSFNSGPFFINAQERVVQALTPLHRFPLHPPRPPELTPPGGLSAERDTYGWLLLFEFVPTAALKLVKGAERSLFVSIFASIILLLATALFWLLSMQTEWRTKNEANRRRLTALGEMTAVLGHELRNPLASLKGHAQLLQESIPEDHPEFESLNTIIKEAKRLEYLTNHILNFARPNTHEPVVFELNSLILEAMESFPAENKVNFSGFAEKYNIFGDPLKLRQAIINLFLNAFQAAPDKDVECALKPKGGGVQIEIRDHGAGILKEHFAELFEPYFTTRTKGTGLGLAIVKSTIKDFKGTITAANHPEGGAVFTVTLPLARGKNVANISC